MSCLQGKGADADLNGADPQCPRIKSELWCKPLVGVIGPDFQWQLQDLRLEGQVVVTGPFGPGFAGGSGHADFVSHDIRYTDPGCVTVFQGLGKNLFQRHAVTGNNGIFQRGSKAIRQHLSSRYQVLSGVLKPGRGEKDHQHNEHNHGGQGTQKQQLAGQRNPGGRGPVHSSEPSNCARA